MNNNFIWKDIVGDLAKGNKKIFGEFYRITYPVAYRVVHPLLHVKEDCEDVLMAVYETIWDERENLTTIINPKAWLLTVCRNEALRFLKKKKKSPTIVSIDDIPVDFQRDSASADSHLIESEMVECYRRVVNALPKRRQQIFRMVREAGLNNKQVAKMQSISEGTVKQQMNRATATLRKKWENIIRL
jgi:RNA polymerase sigma-70 factor (ECF subfamily)